MLRSTIIFCPIHFIGWLPLNAESGDASLTMRSHVSHILATG